MSRFGALAQRLGLALWPARCLACGEAGHAGQDLCLACRLALPWNRNACPRCALPTAPPDAGPGVCGLASERPATAQVRAPSAGACGRCLRAPPPFAAGHSALVYGFPVDRLMPRFKFHADLAAGRLLSQLLLESLAGQPRPQGLVPVPLHPSRLRQRGYDQALELARPLARACALPLLDRALRRVRATAAQSELDARARRHNVRSAFAAAGGGLPSHVALVDDVMTTGATLAECALSLRRAGVARVDVWTVARAVGPGGQ